MTCHQARYLYSCSISHHTVSTWVVLSSINMGCYRRPTPLLPKNILRPIAHNPDMNQVLWSGEPENKSQTMELFKNRCYKKRHLSCTELFLISDLHIVLEVVRYWARLLQRKYKIVWQKVNRNLSTLLWVASDHPASFTWDDGCIRGRKKQNVYSAEITGLYATTLAISLV